MISRKLIGMATAAMLALPGTGAQAADQVKFMFDWIPGGIDGALYAGQSNGCFADQDIEFTFDRGAGGVDTVAKVASGLADLGRADLGTVLLGASGSGAEVKALFPIYSTSPFVILTLADSGIDGLKDLEGRVLSHGPGDSAIQMLPIAMQNAGADLSKVETQTVDFSALLGLLIQGKSDAQTSFLTTARILQNVLAGAGKEGKVIHFGQDLDMYGSVVFATQDFLNERPEVAARAAKALQCAYSKGNENPASAADALLAEFPEKKRAAEEASIAAAQQLIFGNATHEANGFSWDMQRVQTTFKNAKMAKGEDASGDATQFIHTGE